jgi:oxalate decarboxylase/phosphoglucose isomerase-like protein (cupin superfamily)
VRQNVASINVFDEAVTEHTHPALRKASPMVCELNAGESLFIPKGWHHAVISTGDARNRNLAVNTWYVSERASFLTDCTRAP